MEKLTVGRSIWIEAPRERVWQAITDPAQLGQWFIPASMGAQVTRDDSGKLALQMGPMELGFAVLELVDPPHKAVSKGIPDRLISTTYTLTEAKEQGKDGTRVTVTMSGFEAMPLDARQDRLQISGTSWEKALANLKAYVDGAALPHPQPPVAPLFGYWRDDGTKRVIERSVWIKASRERVWAAITDPTQVAQWFSPGTTFKASGSGVGAKLYIEDPETGAEMYTQILEMFDPPTRLIQRTLEEPSTFTGYLLTEENNGTRLTLTHWGYEGQPADTRDQSMEQNTFGFGMMLDNIRAVVEGEPLPMPGGF